MKLNFKSVVLGAFLAYLIPIGLFAAFWYSLGGDHPLYHDLSLPSGRTIKVGSFNLVWGIEHDDRDVSKDSFALEYVSTSPHSDLDALDRETLEVFEVVRPISEQWNFRTASIAAFPLPERKGRYLIYQFTRDQAGKWSHERHAAKVFANDL